VDDEVFDDKDFKDKIKPEYVPDKVSSKVVTGKVIRDDTDNFVGHVAYHSLQAAAHGRD
jgi:hypothetical protein